MCNIVGKPFDPYPYLALSTFINVVSLFTIPILLLTDKAQTKREEIKNDYQFEVYKKMAEDIHSIKEHLDIK